MTRNKSTKTGISTGYVPVVRLVFCCLAAGWWGGCSSARETGETTNDPVQMASPTTIQTDEQRQQIYNQGAGANADPIAKPTNLNEKASDSNRKKNIEEHGADKPGLTPTEVRPQVIKPRVDTVPGAP